MLLNYVSIGAKLTSFKLEFFENKAKHLKSIYFSIVIEMNEGFSNLEETQLSLENSPQFFNNILQIAIPRTPNGK